MACVNRTKIPEYLLGYHPDIPKTFCRPNHYCPKTLVELCGDVLNKFPMPGCWSWSREDVCAWVEYGLKFPQYKRSFFVNYINGRTLQFVDATALPKMNIHDFDHIKQITAAVRELYGDQLERFQTPLCRTSFPSEQHYRQYRYNHKCTRTEFYYLMHIVERPIPQPNHWDVLCTPYFDEHYAGKRVMARC